MQVEIAEICNQVLKRITPNEEDRGKIEALAERLKERVASAAKDFGVEALVRVEGSVAKDTWLREEPDIDIFMRLPTSIPRQSLGETALKIARKALEGYRQVERFAEHPYLEAFVDDVRVNVVPCYMTVPGEWLSATDRTPYHTDYVNNHLSWKMRNEVRLLKRFMKGIGVYGAEIKTGGFSGYLCELLILHYGSFINLLKAFAQYRKRLVIDVKKHYGDSLDELDLLFPEPLVIVDPVDKGRNVASAVQPQKLFTLIVASRAFLKNPSLNFFYPPETMPLPADKLVETIERRGSHMIFIIFEGIDAAPDVLWGQLYKSQRAIARLLELNGFRLLRHAVWSDEKGLNVLLFELESQRLPLVRKHLGPPVEKEKECENFLSKYLANSLMVSGPYIEDERWVVLLKRRYVDAVDLLKEKLMDGGRAIGVAREISQAIAKNMKILVNGEIAEIYLENSDFAKHLTDFLSGKPKWLEKSTC
ncbi:MAG: CCA tRNA nucleotidyltransferase [Candidatus Bathyarchaeia archaeon]